MIPASISSVIAPVDARTFGACLAMCRRGFSRERNAEVMASSQGLSFVARRKMHNQ